VLSYPDGPEITQDLFYYKACRYFEKIGSFDRVFFGKEPIDKYGWFKLKSSAFIPFSPPSRHDEAINVELIADDDEFDHCAGIRVSWTIRDYDTQYWTIFIESNTDALLREQSIDQALYTLLPKAGSQCVPGPRRSTNYVSILGEVEMEARAKKKAAAESEKAAAESETGD
jgi:hypothetical protein